VRAFIDGGIVENLGVEGLRRYLTLPRASLLSVVGEKRNRRRRSCPAISGRCRR
jgi:hypothetical protein